MTRTCTRRVLPGPGGGRADGVTYFGVRTSRRRSGGAVRSPSSAPSAVCAAGYLLPRHGVRLGAPSPPFYGFFDPVLTPWTAVAAAGLAAAVVAAPAAAGGAETGRSCWLRAAGAGRAGGRQHRPPRPGRAGAAADRADRPRTTCSPRSTCSPTTRWDSFSSTPSRVHDLGLPIHVMGHPPGSTVLAGALGAIGLGGPWPAAAAILLIGSLAAPLVLLLGTDAARRAGGADRDARLALRPQRGAGERDLVRRRVRHRRHGHRAARAPAAAQAAAAAAVVCSFLSYALLRCPGLVAGTARRPRRGPAAPHCWRR